MEQGYNPGYSQRPDFQPVTEPITSGETPPESETPPSENTPDPKPSIPPAQAPTPDNQGSPSNEPEPGDDDKPEIPPINEGDTNGGDVWDGRNSKDSSICDGDFFEENKELIKKLKNILDFIYPNSGIDLAKLITSGMEYICGKAEGGGEGTGEVSPPSSDDEPPMIAQNPVNPGQQGTSQPNPQTPPAQTPTQSNSIVAEDELDRIIDAYNEINQKANNRYNRYAKTDVIITSLISDSERNDPTKRALLKNAIARLEEYVHNRCGKKIITLVDVVDILMYINDFLAETVRYDLSNDDHNSLWGCLANPKAKNQSGCLVVNTACLGYSTAFVFLCCYVNSTNRSAIKVDYCFLTVYNNYIKKEKKYDIDYESNDNHIFNCVKINDKWYYIDVAYSNLAGLEHFGKNDSAPFGYDHELFLSGDASNYNEKVLNGSDGKKFTVAGSPDETLDIPSDNIEKRTLKSSKENLYYEHLFTMHNNYSDKMKKNYLDQYPKLVEKNYTCSFIDDIVMFNNDIENVSKDYCIHVAFLIRGDALETVRYQIGNVKRDVPIAYFYLVGLAKAGKKVLIEIIGKDGMCSNEVLSKYKSTSDYVLSIFENFYAENRSSTQGISRFEINKTNINYYVNTIYLKKKPEGSS